MRAACLWIAILCGCGFQIGATVDAAVDVGDGPPDVPDVPMPPMRATTGLLALWTFSEGAGTVARDTSGTVPALDLTVRRGSVTWDATAGTMTLGPITELGSTLPDSGVATVVNGTSGVTFEVWTQPTFASPTPVMIAGVSQDVISRNVSIFQIGSTWVGRIRTSSDPDGGPPLVATTPATTAMTHLVLVADSTQRTFYVNGVAEAVSTAAAPVGWANFPMQLGSERNNAVTWQGTFALTAIYRRGLSAQEVRDNFLAGSSVP
ncbi:MAG: Planctomycete cytochrome [Deltaproteobacteria bacterium]|nr:Planctomycete cytochrome [Deltaproteobacteria bacterium]